MNYISWYLCPWLQYMSCLGLTNIYNQYVQAEMIEEEWTTEPWSWLKTLPQNFLLIIRSFEMNYLGLPPGSLRAPNIVSNTLLQMISYKISYIRLQRHLLILHYRAHSTAGMLYSILNQLWKLLWDTLEAKEVVVKQPFCKLWNTVF